MKKQEIIDLLETAYKAIDNGLEEPSYDRLETKVAKGMDLILEAIKEIKEL